MVNIIRLYIHVDAESRIVLSYQYTYNLGRYRYLSSARRSTRFCVKEAHEKTEDARWFTAQDTSSRRCLFLTLALH